MSISESLQGEDAAGMSDFFHLLFTAPEHRYTSHVRYSLDMIGEIAQAYNETVDRGDFLAAATMVDAFYVHIRLLGDFLVRNTDKRDFGPAQFGVMDWTRSTSDEAHRLEEYWATASTYVVHFGRPRVPADISDLRAFPVDSATFQAMTRDALLVFALFLQKLSAVTPVWAGGARVPSREHEPEEFERRLLFERTEKMSRSFEEACKKVGLDAGSVLATVASATQATGTT